MSFVSDMTDAQLRRKLIAVLPIGNTDPNEATRRIGQNLKGLGWRGLYDLKIKPVLDLGVERHAITLPAGVNAGEDMDADGFLEAQRAGLAWVSDGFVEINQRIIAQGKESIIYNGSLRGDLDGKAKLVEMGAVVFDCVKKTAVGHITKIDRAAGVAYFSDDAGNVLGNVDIATGERWDEAHVPRRKVFQAEGGSAWVMWAVESITMMLRGGCSIVNDGLSGWTIDHPAWSLMQALMRQGVKVYGESYPDWAQTWLTTMNVWIASNTFFNGWFQYSGWPMQRGLITGEVIHAITLSGIQAFNRDGTVAYSKTQTVPLLNADGTKNPYGGKPLALSTRLNPDGTVIPWSSANDYQQSLAIVCAGRTAAMAAVYNQPGFTVDKWCADVRALDAKLQAA